MNILGEILQWSQDRPAWQRDALRRLMTCVGLKETDIDELTSICKSAHGLAKQYESIPLSEKHVNGKDVESEQVILTSISHGSGVNALANNQTIKFCPKITVVYGDNAAGKTGYIRIFKSACRARGREVILGNVNKVDSPQNLNVSIKYKVGTEEKEREWSGVDNDEFIGRVSIFDSKCASVYLTERTDVAFRPFGLDLFDSLVKICKDVRSRLETELSNISASLLTALLQRIPQETHIAKLLVGLSIFTEPEMIRTHAIFSKEDEIKYSTLEKTLHDIQTNSPEKLAQLFSIAARRARTLAQHFFELEKLFAIETITDIFEIRKRYIRKIEESKILREATFSESDLKGTGTELWSALWEAARKFSQAYAYKGEAFPYIDEGARCVLCQQNYDHATCKKLNHFEEFLSSTIEREQKKEKEILDRKKQDLVEFKILTKELEEIINEISIENEALAAVIKAALASFITRRCAILQLLLSETDSMLDFSESVFISKDVNIYAEQLEQRSRILIGELTEEKRVQLNTEFLELQARKCLADNLETVLEEIERLKKIAAYNLCISETNTRIITIKSSELTRAAVTEQLKLRLQNELHDLNFKSIKVELQEVGGVEGVLYHKIVLARSPSTDLPKVASEGEQRCLSVAAFFAELCTSNDLSGIVFDDPVSSLDYKWRDGIARRLVEEAKRRQVIVFTHDIFFLYLLKQYASEQDVEQFDQYIRQLPTGAGICTDELPWVALPVNKKIGFMKNHFQMAASSFRNGDMSEYEKEATYLYGLLRESWERAVEEVLFNSVVVRFLPYVQTKMVKKVDVNEEDWCTLECGMTKCSRWLTGHDQAAGARADIPNPDELRSDIEALETWIKGIRTRREK